MCSWKESSNNFLLVCLGMITPMHPSPEDELYTINCCPDFRTNHLLCPQPFYPHWGGGALTSSVIGCCLHKGFSHAWHRKRRISTERRSMETSQLWCGPPELSVFWGCGSQTSDIFHTCLQHARKSFLIFSKALELRTWYVGAFESPKSYTC